MEIWRNVIEYSELDAWDYRWSLVCMANSGLTAIPNRNLVLNIGFGAEASHTSSPVHQEIPVSGFCPISHPSMIVVDMEADLFTFMSHYGGKDYERSHSLFWGTLNRLKICFSNPLYYPKRLLKLIKIKFIEEESC